MSQWNDTRVTRNLGLSYPIVQGPFGRGGSTAALAAAVSNLGGPGSFGANELPPADVLKVAAEIRGLTDKPFGMNLWVSTFDIGGDSLDQETYDRVLKILEPYHRELDLAPPPRPSGAARNFENQALALIEAAPAVFSFLVQETDDIFQRRAAQVAFNFEPLHHHHHTHEHYESHPRIRRDLRQIPTGAI